MKVSGIWQQITIIIVETYSSSGYLQNLSTKSFSLFLVRIVSSPSSVYEKGE